MLFRRLRKTISDLRFLPKVDGLEPMPKQDFKRFEKKLIFICTHKTLPITSVSYLQTKNVGIATLSHVHQPCTNTFCMCTCTVCIVCNVFSCKSFCIFFSVLKQHHVKIHLQKKNSLHSGHSTLNIFLLQ